MEKQEKDDTNTTIQEKGNKNIMFYEDRMKNDKIETYN
jgi:hypothetical protein